MFDYFTRKRREHDYSINIDSNIDTVRRKAKAELYRIIEYYRNRERAVKNTHYLSRLLSASLPDIRLNEYDYLNIANSSAIYIAKQFKITSSVNMGAIHKSIFYGDNSYEALLFVKGNVDYFAIKDYFINYSPIRVIYSEDSDMDYYIPYSNKNFTTPRLSVYEIDLVGMLVQYRWWAKWRLSNGDSTNPNVFIATIVLPNMMCTIFDFSIYNRFINISRMIPNEKPINRHPFSIIDMSNVMDRVLLDVYNKVHDQNKELSHILKFIPMVYYKDAKELLDIKHRYNNTNTEWLIVLSRVFVVRDMLNIMGERGMDTNLNLVNEIKITFRYLESRHIKLDSIPMDGIKEDVSNALLTIKEKINL